MHLRTQTVISLHLQQKINKSRVFPAFSCGVNGKGSERGNGLSRNVTLKMLLAVAVDGGRPHCLAGWTVGRAFPAAQTKR